MRIHWKISICLILLITCHVVQSSSTTSSESSTTETATSTSTTEPLSKEKPKDDISVSETNNPKPVEIVKQIRRVNSDGSYTFGYEAEDGTFKIESRDVLGNVKGTFGFVDANGEIKRVSYSASNATDATTPTSKEETVVIQPIPRYNKTISSTTRRPLTSPVYSHVTTTPTSPTRPTVIQAIPRRRLSSPTSAGLSSTTDRPMYGHYITSKLQDTTTKEPTTQREKAIVYATSAPTTRPVIIMRPTSQVHTHKISEGQLIRPDEQKSTTKSSVEASSVRRVVVSRRPLDPVTETASTTEKPVYESLSDKDIESKKSIRGNSLRRQLKPEKDITFEAQQHILNYHQSAGDDSTDVYGGSITSGRPLFTTTNSPPRHISAVLAARHRQLSQQSPQTESSTSTIREYVRQPQRLPETSTLDPTSESPSEPENYLTQNPIPVLQIPANREGPHHIPLYRPRQTSITVNEFKTREFLRENPGAPIPIGNQRTDFRARSNTEDNGQYLRETTPSPPLRATATSQIPYPIDDGTTPGPILIRQAHRRPIPVDDRDYIQNTVTPYPQDFRRPQFVPNYRQPPQYLDNQIGIPLTTRDFQKLLQQLLIKHNRAQQYNSGGYSPNPYFSSPYPQYQNPEYSNPQYQSPAPYEQPQYPEYRQLQPIPRQPYYDNQNVGPVTFEPQPSRPYNMYRQPPPPRQYQDQPEYNSVSPDPIDPFEGQRFVARRRLGYRPRYVHRFEPQEVQNVDPYDQPSVLLPPEVREALLLRMLMLAISPDNAVTPEPSNEVTTVTPFEKSKPVRSVQILGEEIDQGNKRIKRYPVVITHSKTPQY